MPRRGRRPPWCGHRSGPRGRDWPQADPTGPCSVVAAVRWRVQLSPDKRDEKLAGAAEETGTGRAASAGAGGGRPGTRADPALLTARAALAARTRELAEAVVLSEAAPAELDAAAAEIANLAARLGARRRPGPIRSAAGAADGRRPDSPVTGRRIRLRRRLRIRGHPRGNRAHRVHPRTRLRGATRRRTWRRLRGHPSFTARVHRRRSEPARHDREADPRATCAPTPLGVPLAAEAWIRGVERSAPPSWTAGSFNERGEPTVEATGEFCPCHCTGSATRTGTPDRPAASPLITWGGCRLTCIGR